LHRLYSANVVHPDAPSVALAFTVHPVTASHSSTTLHTWLRWLYCAYVVDPDAPSRRSTSRRSVALALAVHPATLSRSSTTMCAVARLVVRLHWLYFGHAVHHDYLSRGNTGSTSSTSRIAATSSSGHIMLTTHLD
jgi:hypothetical protein